MREMGWEGFLLDCWGEYQPLVRHSITGGTRVSDEGEGV